MPILMLAALAFFGALATSRALTRRAMARLEPAHKVALVDLAAKRRTLGWIPLLAAFGSLAWWPREHLLTGWRVCAVLFVGQVLAQTALGWRRLAAAGLPAEFLAVQRRALALVAAGSLALLAGILLAFR